MTKAQFRFLKRKLLIHSPKGDHADINEIFDAYYYGLPVHGMASDKERKAHMRRRLKRMQKIMKGLNISKEEGWE